MTDERGNQKGAQRHAEGQQGPKTRTRQQEELQSGERGESARQDAQHPTDGGHRLFERREQHDEADLNSEKNRLRSDIEAHGHARDDSHLPGKGGS